MSNLKEKKITPLKDLTLLHRFLFSEAAEDQQFMEDVLSIIMDEDIKLAGPPQTEKEVRDSSEPRKYIRLDVWSLDEENIYDTEVQRDDTKNIPKRSRYYQALIDSKLLEIGDSHYEKLKRVYMIMIMPFDLFDRNRYMYTFRMSCIEEPDLALEDDAYRIFLNTKGKDAENIRPELKALLEFFENPSEEVAQRSGNERILRIQQRVKSLKDNAEVGVKYMRAWEEKEFARQEGLIEGEAIGAERVNKLNALLLERNLIDELKRASLDKVYQEELFEKYGIK